MLTENQAKWIFGKLIKLFQIPRSEVEQEANNIIKLSRNNQTVKDLIEVCLRESDADSGKDHYTEILTDYRKLTADSNPKNDEQWRAFYMAVNKFREKYNYTPFVQELSDALCREMRRKMKGEGNEQRGDY